MPLRRTANLDIDLLSGDQQKRKSLEQALNCFVMIEAAFASVTAGILFVFIGLFVTGSLKLDPVDFIIARAAFFALSVATVAWLFSLEELSHMVSPSLTDRVFCNLYKEAFNLWNLGLMLLVFAACCVLVLVDAGLAAAVTAVSTALAARTLYLVHGWDDNGFERRVASERNRKMKLIRSSIRGSASEKRPGRATTFTLAALFLLLFPLYSPLNVARDSMHNLRTAVDAWIPLVPIFSVPYVSYFPFLVVSAVLVARSGGKGRLDRLLLSGILTLAAAYLAYGFFQTQVVRPAVDPGTSPFHRLVAFVYSQDNPYNDFPSLHTALTACCALALLRLPRFRWPMAAWAASIVASTVLIKQHYVADLVSGLILAYGASLVAERALPDSLHGASTSPPLAPGVEVALVGMPGGTAAVVELPPPLEVQELASGPQAKTSSEAKPKIGP
jgi:membrane-associated phospholipid phosphatase